MTRAVVPAKYHSNASTCAVTLFGTADRLMELLVTQLGVRKCRVTQERALHPSGCSGASSWRPTDAVSPARLAGTGTS